MDITVRLVTIDDAPTIHRLTQAAFAQFADTLQPPSSALDETVEVVESAIAGGGAAVAELAGEAVGSVRFRVEPDHLSVGRLAVLPNRRGQGVSRALLTFVEAYAAALGVGETRVEVRRALPDNIAMFERLGYRIVAERAHPRGPGFTTVTMAKQVGDGEGNAR